VNPHSQDANHTKVQSGIQQFLFMLFERGQARKAFSSQPSSSRKEKNPRTFVRGFFFLVGALIIWSNPSL
jgi:hypothetical protein